MPREMSLGMEGYTKKEPIKEESFEEKLERMQKEWKAFGKLLSEAVLGREGEDHELFHTEISLEQVVDFLNSEMTPEELKTMKYSENDIDPEFLADTIPSMNADILMKAIQDRSLEEVDTTSESYREFVKFVEHVADSAYRVADIFTTKEKRRRDQDARIISEASQNVGMLMRAAGENTDTAIAVKTMYAQLLLQGLRTEQANLGWYIQKEENRKHHRFGPERILEMTKGHMGGDAIRSIGMQLFLMRSLDNVSYIKDVKFSSMNDNRARGSHVSFRVDPEQYDGKHRRGRKGLPKDFIDSFSIFVRFDEIACGQYGPISEGVQVFIPEDESARNKIAIYYGKEEEDRLGIWVNAYFDSSLEKSVRLRAPEGDVSFFTFNFDGWGERELPDLSEIAEKVVKRLIDIYDYNSSH